jgi:hypothetical protein
MSKGPHDSRTDSYQKRRDEHARIFGKKKPKSTKPKGFKNVGPSKVRKVYK